MSNTIGAMAESGGNLTRIQVLAMELPEAERVDVEAWEGEPTFRVRGKNFVFASKDGSGFSLKVDKEEAEAVVASDPDAVPTGYGLGRHGWISVSLPSSVGEERWEVVREWIRTSYALVAPKKLARAVLDEDGLLRD